jgi:hypothetical protein
VKIRAVRSSHDGNIRGARCEATDGMFAVEAPVTRLLAYEHVMCSTALTETYAEHYLEDLGNPSGSVCFRLRVPTADLSIPGGVVLEKGVIAKVSRKFDDAHINKLITIEWEPEGGAFPRFSGTLIAEPVDDGSSTLILDGQYTPPGGAAGALFDGAVGFWIARATARELLRQIRDGVEAKYRAAFPPALRPDNAAQEPLVSEEPPKEAAGARPERGRSQP